MGRSTGTGMPTVLSAGMKACGSGTVPAQASASGSGAACAAAALTSAEGTGLAGRTTELVVSREGLLPPKPQLVRARQVMTIAETAEKGRMRTRTQYKSRRQPRRQDPLTRLANGKLPRKIESNLYAGRVASDFALSENSQETAG